MVSTLVLFVTALEILCEQHLQIQAAYQRHVDNSVSKTINLPHEVTREEIAHAYLRAWEPGLTGITIYRYDGKSSQVLELGAEEEPQRHDHASRCDPQECRIWSLMVRIQSWPSGGDTVVTHFPSAGQFRVKQWQFPVREFRSSG